MPWWVWIIAGFLLLIAELFFPSGFVLIFVGSGFVLTGALVSLGLLGQAWLQWTACGVISLILLMALRGRVVSRFVSPQREGAEALPGAEVLIKDDILPGAVGAGEMHGASWSVKNIGSTTLKGGERCKVHAVRGVTLDVMKEGSEKI